MFAIFLRSIFASIISFFGFEMMVNHRHFIFWIAASLLIVLFFIAFSIVRICRTKLHRQNYIFFPLLCFLSAITFFVFIPGKIFQQIYIVLSSLLFGGLFFYVGNFILGHTEVKKTFHHYNLFDVVVLACSFFSFSGLFGLFLFLKWQTFILLLISLALCLFLTYYYFWYNRLDDKKNYLVYLVFSLVAVEAAWSMTFWSTGFLARGLTLFVFFYLLCGLYKHHLQKTLSKKIIYEHLFVGLIVLALVLGTTRWSF